MGKMTRADILRELVEDASEQNGKDEWREGKKDRSFKSLRESKSPKDKGKRRAWKLQRAIQHGEYDFTGSKDKKLNRNEEFENDERN